MPAVAKIYRVVAQDYMLRHWHFATKGAAKDFVKRWMKDFNSDGDYNEPEIEYVLVPLNSRGIAQALDDFIELTCMNEG